MRSLKNHPERNALCFDNTRWEWLYLMTMANFMWESTDAAPRDDNVLDGYKQDICCIRGHFNMSFLLGLSAAGSLAYFFTYSHPAIWNLFRRRQLVQRTTLGIKLCLRTYLSACIHVMFFVFYLACKLFEGRLCLSVLCLGSDSLKDTQVCILHELSIGAVGFRGPAHREPRTQVSPVRTSTKVVT